MIIDGNKIAEEIRGRLKEKVAKLKGRAPGLAFICIGEYAPSRSYINMKKKRCREIGILSEDVELPESTPEKELLLIIEKLNRSSHIDGILVQLPLPPHINVQNIMEAIDPEKDVDGFHPMNLGRLLLGQTDGLLPCTPKGIVRMLEHANVTVSGKHVVILGRSNIVGKPLAAMLMQKHPLGNATVTVAHSMTKDLTEVCRSAEILVAAIGQPHFVKASMIKTGCTVIDVGINRTLESTSVVGDVDYDRVAPLCSNITKVPGGVGPMTIAMLLENTLHSYQLKQKT